MNHEPKSPELTPLDALSQSQRERLAFIEFRLWFLGDVRRPDLIERFGIAPAVATRDLAAYREHAPQNIAFDGRRKVYVPIAGFVPLFAHRPERVMSALSRGFGDSQSRQPVGYLSCDFPLRLNQPPLEVLAVVTRSIHQAQPVEMLYHSLNRGPSRRVVVPLALVDSGLRWHIRAYDRLSQDFRDLVITRIEAPVALPATAVEAHECLAMDPEWNRQVTLELVPHPQQARPEIVARDFAMQDGRRILEVRAAIAGYVLQQWSVDCSADHRLAPTHYRLWLRNHEVLQGVRNALLAPGYGLDG